MLLAFIGLIAAFVVTAAVARTYHQRRATLARQWSRSGAADLAAGHAAAAVVDFQATLIYARGAVNDTDMQSYELQLAQALFGAQHSDEARAYLIDLWQDEPESGEVNLELARLAARAGDDTEASRYYEAAINGVWQGDEAQMENSRRAARLELFRYLSARGQAVRARVVLMELASELPDDISNHIEMGKLMQAAGQNQLAFDQFQQALRLDPHNGPALLGAGMAAFAAGSDRDAVRYLREASREHDLTDSGSRQALSIAEAGTELDPFETGLEISEQASRAENSFRVAVRRLMECAVSQGITLPVAHAKRPVNSAVTSTPSSDGLVSLYSRAVAMEPSVRAMALEKEPSQIGAVMAFVFQMEDTSTERCGPPSRPENMALARLEKERTAIAQGQQR